MGNAITSHVEEKEADAQAATGPANEEATA